jgi:hypothetical protein
MPALLMLHSILESRLVFVLARAIPTFRTTGHFLVDQLTKNQSSSFIYMLQMTCATYYWCIDVTGHFKPSFAAAFLLLASSVLL